MLLKVWINAALPTGVPLLLGADFEMKSKEVNLTKERVTNKEDLGLFVGHVWVIYGKSRKIQTNVGKNKIQGSLGRISAKNPSNNGVMLRTL